MSSQTRSRRTLIIVLIAFLLPVIVAWIILDQHWYQAGTNKGTLLATPISLEHTEQLPQGWKLGFIAPSDCSEACENAILVMNQIDIAVGKDTERVVPVVFTQADNSAVEAAVTQYDLELRRNSPVINELAAIPDNSLFIIDPLNNVMLYYPTHANKEQMILEGKNVLADLRKLLKLSKIG